ncbi:MAG: hypothetical protein H6729_00465 [Deltaproteobacteria bacterium]|nr:hypothetical protein [Deltaproteobacteria bacterium]
MKNRILSLTQSLERLSAREQVLVVFLVFLLMAMFLGFGGYVVSQSQSAREKRIAAKIEKLKEVAAARGDYRRLLGEQERLAEEVRGNKGTRLLTYLEDLAKKSNIDLGNASERAGDPTGSDAVREDAAEVLIKNVSIDRLYAFLRLIEEGNRLVIVRRLKINTRFDNKEMLDAAVTVGTFKPGQES